MEYTAIPDDQTIEQTAAALRGNGMEVFIVPNGLEAKKKALELIPDGAEVMNMTSVTLDTITLERELKESGKYKSVRKILESMDRNTQHREMNKLGAAPDWAVGSVHALTQDGKVLVASNTGSQLPAYAYAAPHILWVVGAQKIVKNLDEAFKRVYEYTLPLESVRLNKAYNIATGSFVSKILIINREINKDRIKIILVKEALGF